MVHPLNGCGSRGAGAACLRKSVSRSQTTMDIAGHNESILGCLVCRFTRNRLPNKVVQHGKVSPSVEWPPILAQSVFTNCCTVTPLREQKQKRKAPWRHTARFGGDRQSGMTAWAHFRCTSSEVMVPRLLVDSNSTTQTWRRKPRKLLNASSTSPCVKPS